MQLSEVSDYSVQKVLDSYHNQVTFSSVVLQMSFVDRCGRDVCSW